MVAAAVTLVRDTAGAPPDTEKKVVSYSYDPNGNLLNTKDPGPHPKVNSAFNWYRGLLTPGTGLRLRLGLHCDAL